MFRDRLESKDLIRISNEWVGTVYGEGAEIFPKYDPPFFFRGLDIIVGNRAVTYYTEELLLFFQQQNLKEPLDAIKYAFLTCQDLDRKSVV